MIEIIHHLLSIAIALIAIIKPQIISQFVGKLFWNLSKFTMLERNEKTKKYFFGENLFWFRAYGVIMLLLTFFILVINHLEKVRFILN